MRKLLVLLAALLSVGAAQEVRVIRETETTCTVEHALGETDISASPQRIISLNGWLTDPLVALGVTPAGIVSYFGVDDVPPHAEAQLEGVPRVGTWETPNLEAILTLDPDLIIASEFHAAGFGAQLARIAPTVYLEGTVTNPREQLRDMGRLLGQDAAARVAEYDAAIARTRAKLGTAKALRAAFMRVRENDLRLYGGSSSIATLLYDELGFSRAPLTESVPDAEWQVPISLEVLPELGAEVLFYAVEDEVRMNDVSATSLWQNVPAVREGRAFGVPVYFYFGGVLADEYAAQMTLQLLTP